MNATRDVLQELKEKGKGVQTAFAETPQLCKTVERELASLQKEQEAELQSFTKCADHLRPLPVYWSMRTFAMPLTAAVALMQVADEI